MMQAVDMVHLPSMQRSAVEVLDEGSPAERAHKEGSIVAMNYRLTAPGLQGALLESGRSTKFQYLSGAVAPEARA
jgi:hypothetical protein